MGIVFRRFVRRVLFGAGVVLVGAGVLAMGANLFRVAYVWHSGSGTSRHWYFERGVVRFASASASQQVFSGPVSRLSIPGMPPGAAARPSPSPWRMTVARRVTPDDRAFVPYEWLPAYSDDGTTREVVVPWWLLVVAGAAMMSAGLWGIGTPRGLCRKCEYDLRGLPPGAGVCPECGAKLRVGNAPPLCASSTSAHG